MLFNFQRIFLNFQKVIAFFLEGSFDVLKGVQSGGHLITRRLAFLSDATPNVSFL